MHNVVLDSNWKQLEAFQSAVWLWSASDRCNDY